AALRFGENAQAEEAFERMQKLGANTAAHHEIGARIALAAGRLADARAEAARALELEPGNAPARLELAAIEIRSPDPAAQDRARETLERLRAEPPLRHAALRALIGDRVNRGKIPEALALASEFILDPETTFEDRLQYLGILRLKGEPNVEFINSFQGGERLSLGLLKNPAGASFTSYLSQLQDEARETPGKAAALIAFLDAQGLAVLAGEWAVRIPPAIASKPPVAPPLAEAYRLSLEWQRLEDFITGANWDDFEFLRAAFLARLMQEKGDRAGASAQWAAAVNLAAYRPEKLALLVPMAAAWNWTSEWEELVWTIARSSKRPREALAALADFYRSKRDTAKLFEVWSRRLEIDPADVTAKKNWVRISVLLGSDRFRAGTMAQELYKEHPDDTEIVCTYALVQHLRERDDEAIAIMSRLTAEQLRSPAAAGYYGVFLFANNRKKEAAEFIARAKEAPFLPEEQALVDRVRRSLD
ncbi:MAG TPA: hypothetical protein VEO95_08915, partial [Chthoniobacteraceae bacterium]|nr:hypothetical protein [Chthoniobacteraceae bacterium]